jgi:hypothetical protein
MGISCTSWNFLNCWLFPLGNKYELNFEKIHEDIAWGMVQVLERQENI